MHHICLCMQPCIDQVKSLYFAYLNVSQGAAANDPVDAGACERMRSTVNSTLALVLSRDQMMLNLASTLTRAKQHNPLRGLRYLLNAVMKAVEGPFAVDVRGSSECLCLENASCRVGHTQLSTQSCARCMSASVADTAVLLSC